MGTKRLETVDPFTTVRAQLEAWRVGGRRGRRIPEDLWRGAVELARVHGVSKTSVALRLGYKGLQRRLDGARAGAVEVETPTFVELALGGRGAADCVLVFNGGRGRQLRIELRGAATSRLESLAVALAGTCP